MVKIQFVLVCQQILLKRFYEITSERNQMSHTRNNVIIINSIWANFFFSKLIIASCLWCVCRRSVFYFLFFVLLLPPQNRKVHGKHSNFVNSVAVIPCPKDDNNNGKMSLLLLSLSHKTNGTKDRDVKTNYRKLWEIMLTCVVCHCIPFGEIREPEFNVYEAYEIIHRAKFTHLQHCTHHIRRQQNVQLNKMCDTSRKQQ